MDVKSPINLNNSFQTRLQSHSLVVFEIKDHIIMDKQNYVLYHMTVRPKEGYGMSWKVPLRFKDFEKLKNRLSKNSLYKDKLPSFLKKKLLKSTESIITERKIKLAAYMQTLSLNFNIFKDDDIVRFLKREYDDVQIQNLREGYEFEQ